MFPRYFLYLFFVTLSLVPSASLCSSEPDNKTTISRSVADDANIWLLDDICKKITAEAEMPTPHFGRYEPFLNGFVCGSKIAAHLTSIGCDRLIPNIAEAALLTWQETAQNFMDREEETLNFNLKLASGETPTITFHIDFLDGLIEGYHCASLLPEAPIVWTDTCSAEVKKMRKLAHRLNKYDQALDLHNAMTSDLVPRLTMAIASKNSALATELSHKLCSGMAYIAGACMKYNLNERKNPRRRKRFETLQEINASLYAPIAEQGAIPEPAKIDFLLEMEARRAPKNAERTRLQEVLARRREQQTSKAPPSVGAPAAGAGKGLYSVETSSKKDTAGKTKKAPASPKSTDSETSSTGSSADASSASTSASGEETLETRTKEQRLAAQREAAAKLAEDKRLAKIAADELKRALKAAEKAARIAAANTRIEEEQRQIAARVIEDAKQLRAKELQHINEQKQQSAANKTIFDLKKEAQRAAIAEEQRQAIAEEQRQIAARVIEDAKQLRAKEEERGTMHKFKQATKQMAAKDFQRLFRGHRARINTANLRNQKEADEHLARIEVQRKTKPLASYIPGIPYFPSNTSYSYIPLNFYQSPLGSPTQSTPKATGASGLSTPEEATERGTKQAHLFLLENTSNKKREAWINNAHISLAKGHEAKNPDIVAYYTAIIDVYNTEMQLSKLAQRVESRDEKTFIAEYPSTDGEFLEAFDYYQAGLLEGRTAFFHLKTARERLAWLKECIAWRETARENIDLDLNEIASAQGHIDEFVGNYLSAKTK